MAAVFAGLMLAGPARASTMIYANLGNGSGSGVQISSNPSLYQSFTTPSGGYTLSSVIIGLYGNNTSGSIEVSLDTDVSNLPGSLIANLGSISDSAVTCGSECDITVSLLTNPSLASSTTYFIVLTGTLPLSKGGGGDSIWATATNNTGTGVSGSIGSNGSAQPFVMEVEGNPIAGGVPEPGAWLLMAIGLGALAARARSRKARA